MFCYQYLKSTGNIVACTNGSKTDRPDYANMPIEKLFQARVTFKFFDGTIQEQDAIVTSGWSFVTDADGIPTKDENDQYRIIPEADYAPPPDIGSYIFVGMVTAGFLSVDNIDSEIINFINRSLDSVGKPIIPGTVLIPPPKKTAVIIP